MTMRHITKLRFPGPYSVQYEESSFESSQLGERDVLVETQYSLISPGTELALYTGTHIDLPNPANRFAKFPFHPGYSTVGEVIEAGAGSGFARGDCVFTAGHHASHEVLEAADDLVVRLPDGLRPELALFGRIAEISMTSVLLSRVKPGDYVAVLGMGLVGNLAAQLFAQRGAIPIGIDVVPERLELAKQTGVTHVVLSGGDVGKAALREDVHRITGGKDPDIVVEASGVPELVITALELCRQLGQVILLGSTRGLVTLNVYELIHRKGVSLTGAHASLKGVEGLPTSGELYREVLGMIQSGTLCVEPFITHRLPSSEAKRAYELLLHHKNRACGVILDWRGRE
ncbi:zinc-binding alcohol dehydrogenase [Paenibacillus sp. OV219]|uniref:zinc-dependent alcohol dehydrogenase n=1 Tax=Paenibacillus sp. OV219 TaxID=1884377 RepID=UPI0008CD9E84|nr:zinc-binding alcohol dehydrogenase [Paenibacillus sp. OV219]SEN87361.1 2-desacetyl-2-hydroxyethyl bacteriochlorophyllide A dehydrogenase [Paenibacillus sp. OV219]